ncbi:hypothetical protein KEM54_002807, partial [Ascosphaera aggregata]
MFMPLPQIEPRETNNATSHGHQGHATTTTTTTATAATRTSAFAAPISNYHPSRQSVVGFPGIGSLSSLHHEEVILRRRKQAIAVFGQSWIRPAGCTKTMLNVREEAAEREAVERANMLTSSAMMAGGDPAIAATVAAAADFGFVVEPSTQMDVDGGSGEDLENEGDSDADDQMGMGRDLDEDIPE